MDVNNWNDNRMQEWTVTIERELMRNTVLKLSYTGNHGSNLQQHWDLNSPMARYNYQAATGNLAPTNGDLRRINPNWNLTGSYGVLQHNGYSNANSAQANIERRFTGGLAFQAFYVYTHVADNERHRRILLRTGEYQFQYDERTQRRLCDFRSRKHRDPR